MTRRRSSSGSGLRPVPRRSTLLDLAGERSFERGERYFLDGSVSALKVGSDVVSATVRGSRLYKVRLWQTSHGPGFHCTCPMGVDGDFCKHCVAVGLACLDQDRPEVPASPGKGRDIVTQKDVRKYLNDCGFGDLVKLILDRAKTDDDFNQWLLMKAARAGKKRIDHNRIRKAIDQALIVDGFIGYDEVHDYLSGVHDATARLHELLAEGHAADAVGLIEHALLKAEEVMEYVDDGQMSMVLDELQDLHLRACRKARPDPEALSERLFRWELSSEWGTFEGAAQTYARILGKKGMAAYRRLAQAEWARVPAREPGDRKSQGTLERHQITRIMETLARQSGDVEAEVAILAHDLSTPFAFVNIVERYRQARRFNAALEWAEKGVGAFPERVDGRLYELLANEYHRRRRHDEAVTLAWAVYADSPVLETYRQLKRHADKSGQWPAWRPKALDFLRKTIDEERRNTGGKGRTWFSPAHNGELVRILLWEDDVDAAWQEARKRGCTESLWLELAARRERACPEDALPIYQRQIEPALSQKNKDAYGRAVHYLDKVRLLMKRLERSDEFVGLLEHVRAEHWRKRNFIKLLDARRWS